MRGFQASTNLLHKEKDGLLPGAFACASYLTVDDTGARHRGRNGYTTHIGNELFAWFGSTKSKSRINFLQLLRAGHEDYRVDAEALAYRRAQKLPHGPLERLRTDSDGLFANEAYWNAHLTRLGITQERHRRIATEGALLGSVLHYGFPKDLPVVSDDAGQFNVLCHGLCWVMPSGSSTRSFPSTQRTGKNSPRCAVNSGSCMPT